MAKIRFGKTVRCVACNWTRTFSTDLIAAEVCDIHNLARHGTC